MAPTSPQTPLAPNASTRTLSPSKGRAHSAHVSAPISSGMCARRMWISIMLLLSLAFLGCGYVYPWWSFRLLVHRGRDLEGRSEQHVDSGRASKRPPLWRVGIAYALRYLELSADTLDPVKEQLALFVVQ